MILIIKFSEESIDFDQHFFVLIKKIKIEYQNIISIL